MLVSVKYFASFRERLGLSSEEICFPATVTSVAEARQFLAQRGGVWSELLSDSAYSLVAVNHQMAEATTRLSAADELAFFPPVSGG